jgi:hypothetical protein
LVKIVSKLINSKFGLNKLKKWKIIYNKYLIDLYVLLNGYINIFLFKILIFIKNNKFLLNS